MAGPIYIDINNVLLGRVGLGYCSYPSKVSLEVLGSTLEAWVWERRATWRHAGSSQAKPNQAVCTSAYMPYALFCAHVFVTGIMIKCCIMFCTV